MNNVYQYNRDIDHFALESDQIDLNSEEKLNFTNITVWKERWFLSSNAKDIGTLYLMFALFSGLIGTAFSVLIRLELSGPGVQYIGDNQLYNSIITSTCYINDFFYGYACFDRWLR